VIHVFLGPTLPAAEARALLGPAVFHGPVAQGDVLRADRAGATVIVIIDGYFELVPSVWHKEILVALERGITVCGAASMGALRAVELARYGMIGVGQVYEWFANGSLTDDDEVAVTHAPAEDGYRQHSDAMVDIRHHLAVAASEGAIGAETADLLIERLKSRHYPDRSLMGELVAMERAHEEPVDELARLRSWLGAGRQGIKERDAIELLTRVSRDELPDSKVGATTAVEHTVFLDQLQSEVERMDLLAGAATASAVHDPETRLAHGETLAVTRKKMLLRILIRRESERMGLAVAPEELHAESDRFRREMGLLSLEETLRWFERQGIDERTWTEFLRDRVLAVKLEHLFDREIDASIGSHVRIATPVTDV